MNNDPNTRLDNAARVIQALQTEMKETREMQRLCLQVLTLIQKQNALPPEAANLVDEIRHRFGGHLVA